MSDTKITYNEWDDLDHSKDYGFEDGAIHDLTEWPIGAQEDGKLYRICWTQNQRAIMQNGDRHPDNPELDVDGTIQWVAVDPRFTEPSEGIISAIDGKKGSYLAMAKIADTLNVRQDKNFGTRSFTFYPHPMEMAGTL